MSYHLGFCLGSCISHKSTQVQFPAGSLESRMRTQMVGCYHPSGGLGMSSRLQTSPGQAMTAVMFWEQTSKWTLSASHLPFIHLIEKWINKYLKKKKLKLKIPLLILCIKYKVWDWVLNVVFLHESYHLWNTIMYEFYELYVV